MPGASPGGRVSAVAAPVSPVALVTSPAGVAASASVVAGMGILQKAE